MDTKNLKEMLDLVITGANAGQLVMADGKIGVDDIGHLMILVPKLGPAFEDIKLIKDEAFDIDASESYELVAFVMEKLTLNDAKAKIYIKAALEMLVKLYDAVQIFMAMKSEIAALEPVVPAPEAAPAPAQG